MRPRRLWKYRSKAQTVSLLLPRETRGFGVATAGAGDKTAQDQWGGLAGGVDAEADFRTLYLAATNAQEI